MHGEREVYKPVKTGSGSCVWFNSFNHAGLSMLQSGQTGAWYVGDCRRMGKNTAHKYTYAVSVNWNLRCPTEPNQIWKYNTGQSWGNGTVIYGATAKDAGNCFIFV